jgi:hypothetical protein
VGPRDAANPNNPNNARVDSDCDGLSDAEEFSTIYPNGLKTDPSNPDSDGDGISDGIESARTSSVSGSGCPVLVADADPRSHTSPVASDTDGDGIGDACDDDADADGINNSLDNCPFKANQNQTDSDFDNYGDACDVCPNLWNPDSEQDQDGDGVGDMCDSCSTIANPIQGDGRQSAIPDTDNDGIDDCLDTCPLIPNSLDQKSDTDGDGVPNACDNCPDLANSNQIDKDHNDKGDACEFVVIPGLRRDVTTPESRRNLERAGEKLFKNPIDETFTDKLIKSFKKYWPF